MKEDRERLSNALWGVVMLTLTGMFFYAAINKEIRLYQAEIHQQQVNRG